MLKAIITVGISASGKTSAILNTGWNNKTGKGST